jgi:spore coat protein U-like protein
MQYLKFIPMIALALYPATASSQSTDCAVSASGVAFGTLGMLDFAEDATGEISVTCTNLTPFTIGLDGGQAAAGPSNRRLSSGAHLIPYGLYKDSARSVHWGLEGESEGPVSGLGTGSLQLFQVFGRIPAQSAPTPGFYSDVISVTVTY